jgi:hypothetical protein
MLIQHNYSLGLADKIRMMKEKREKNEQDAMEQGMSKSELAQMKAVIK